MTTELLFRSDAYLKTAQAHVVAVHERGIELDRTIFYPMGGGQSGDSGVLLRASGERIAHSLAAVLTIVGRGARHQRREHQACHR